MQNVNFPNSDFDSFFSILVVQECMLYSQYLLFFQTNIFWRFTSYKQHKSKQIKTGENIKHGSTAEADTRNSNFPNIDFYILFQYFRGTKMQLVHVV